MHPMVKPALRRAWRSLRCVQFGVTPAHAVVLDPVGPETEAVLGLLDGTRGIELLRAEARTRGLPDGRLEALLGRLESAGLLTDAATGRPGRAGPAAGAADAVLDPLRADLASLSVVHPEPERAAGALAARRALRVQVRGAGRVGATVAALLAAAGVGRVEVLDSGRVEPWETAPGGLPPEAVGERRATAARRLVGHWSRGAARGGPGEGGTGAGLSLVVVAPRDGLGAYVPDPLPAERWVSTGVPHLYAGVVEATGVVGPLVLPGGTACARCLQEERTDRDPVRPRLLAQWRSGAPHPLPACDLGLATAVAGLAAAHALAFLDGNLPASTGTRWEASLPFLEWRTERLRPHPACPCGAARGGKGERASAALDAHDTMAG
ncbi:MULTISPECIES: TOMM precursor leader peptide-binding protein [unclassified Streptomyces]|uniref:TOMM precursor leader peptide-binding protein n=1 Tax=unclassified Streptomyces TaxID=2593676 RepID=UPI0006AFAEA3|nr:MULTISPECIES: TOMM precursor leader peptide-binding protein [unclassified Streptomyces]KOX34955.1 thiamine biosynthesis protein ThiF [Streptomyces sp. NRRL F-6491]KOX50874.1 thiamine biosynthesis protein ThiF [Streptomyces sp. NRRL F-6492]